MRIFKGLTRPSHLGLHWTFLHAVGSLAFSFMAFHRPSTFLRRCWTICSKAQQVRHRSFRQAPWKISCQSGVSPHLTIDRRSSIFQDVGSGQCDDASQSPGCVGWFHHQPPPLEAFTALLWNCFFCEKCIISTSAGSHMLIPGLSLRLPWGAIRIIVNVRKGLYWFPSGWSYSTFDIRCEAFLFSVTWSNNVKILFKLLFGVSISLFVALWSFKWRWKLLPDNKW